MVVKYQGEFFQTTDESLDVGYEAPKVTLKDFDNFDVEVGGYKKIPQLIVSLPFLDGDSLKEIEALRECLNDFVKSQIAFYVVINDKKSYKLPEMIDEERFTLVFDTPDEFGEYYGVKISNGSLKSKLLKAAFVVSKDGSLFYDEIPENLEDSLDNDKIFQKVVSTISQYTGVGCHG